MIGGNGTIIPYTRLGPIGVVLPWIAFTCTVHIICNACWPRWPPFTLHIDACQNGTAAGFNPMGSSVVTYHFWTSHLCTTTRSADNCLAMVVDEGSGEFGWVV